MAKTPPDVGDKCPRCHSGLVEKTEMGLCCDSCSWEMDLDEFVRRTKDAKVGKSSGFKAAKFSIIIDDPDTAEDFLRGLIVARSNNSSEYFVELIDAVNTILEPYRQKRLEDEMSERAAAGMG
jgi:hypothetical protein